MSRPSALADARAGVNPPTTPRFFDHPTLARGDDVPPTRSHIRRTAEAYLERYPDERRSLAGLLSVLDSNDDPCSRATLPGHVICSGRPALGTGRGGRRQAVGAGQAAWALRRRSAASASSASEARASRGCSGAQ